MEDNKARSISNQPHAGDEETKETRKMKKIKERFNALSPLKIKGIDEFLINEIQKKK